MKRLVWGPWVNYKEERISLISDGHLFHVEQIPKLLEMLFACQNPYGLRHFIKIPNKWMNILVFVIRLFTVKWSRIILIKINIIKMMTFQNCTAVLLAIFFNFYLMWLYGAKLSIISKQTIRSQMIGIFCYRIKLCV